MGERRIPAEDVVQHLRDYRKTWEQKHPELVKQYRLTSYKNILERNGRVILLTEELPECFHGPEGRELLLKIAKEYADEN